MHASLYQRLLGLSFVSQCSKLNCLAELVTDLQSG